MKQINKHLIAHKMDERAIKNRKELLKEAVENHQHMVKKGNAMQMGKIKKNELSIYLSKQLGIHYNDKSVMINK